MSGSQKHNSLLRMGRSGVTIFSYSCLGVAVAPVGVLPRSVSCFRLRLAGTHRGFFLPFWGLFFHSSATARVSPAPCFVLLGAGDFALEAGVEVDFVRLLPCFCPRGESA